MRINSATLVLLSALLAWGCGPASQTVEIDASSRDAAEVAAPPRIPRGIRGVPLVPPGDSSWAALGRPCPVDGSAAVWNAPKEHAPDPRSRRNPDDGWAAAARWRPGGFAGEYWGRAPEWLTDEEQQVIARPFIVLFVDTLAGAADLGPQLCRPRPFRECVIMQPARWNFAQLYDWYAELASAAWGTGVVVMSGIAESDNRIIYGVRNAADREVLERRLAELNVPCFLVGIERREPLR